MSITIENLDEFLRNGGKMPTKSDLTARITSIPIEINGEIFPLEMEWNNTIDDLKKMISKERGIPIDKQTVVINEIFKDSDGSKLLCDCRLFFTPMQQERFHNFVWIVHKDDNTKKETKEVEGEEEKINIVTKLGYVKTHHYDFDASGTVLDLAFAIQRREGFPLFQMILVFEGNEIKMTQKLKDVGIRNESLVTVYFRMKKGDNGYPPRMKFHKKMT